MIKEKIITSFDAPPIPVRVWDWAAKRESYEAGDLIGFGATEDEAIEDLLTKEQDHDL